jgi:hypothetical protein
LIRGNVIKVTGGLIIHGVNRNIDY